MKTSPWGFPVMERNLMGEQNSELEEGPREGAGATGDLQWCNDCGILWEKEREGNSAQLPEVDVDSRRTALLFH